MDWTLIEWGGIGTLIAAIATLLIGWVKGKQDGRRLAQEMLVAALDRANADIDRLVARVQMLEVTQRDTALMMAHMESLYSWIERGMRPPAPARPGWLQPGAFSPLTTQKAQATPQEES